MVEPLLACRVAAAVGLGVERGSVPGTELVPRPALARRLMEMHRYISWIHHNLSSLPSRKRRGRTEAHWERVAVFVGLHRKAPSVVATVLSCPGRG